MNIKNFEKTKGEKRHIFIGKFQNKLLSSALIFSKSV